MSSAIFSKESQFNSPQSHNSAEKHKNVFLCTVIVLLLATSSGCGYLVTQEKYRIKEDELVEMTEKFKKQQGETQSIEGKYSEKLKIIEDRNESVKKLEAAIAQRDKVIGEKDTAIATQEELIKQKEKTIARQDEIIQKKDKEVEKLEALRKKAEDEAEVLSYRIKKLKEQVDVKKAKIDDLTKTTESLESKIEQYNVQLEDLSAKYSTNKLENEKLDTEKKRLISEVLELKNNLNEQKIKLVFLKNERDNLDSTIQAIKYLVADFQISRKKPDAEIPQRLLQPVSPQEGKEKAVKPESDLPDEPQSVDSKNETEELDLVPGHLPE